ncbi:MAG: NAD(+) diphosphatase, partial [Bacteroidaceae bacterium]|nr:NAD(+) diphosphatase [Bacteroidaceae bacterium]
GTRLTPGTNPQESSLTCPQCHNTIFPRIEPCIIVLVKRGNEILLAQHSQRNTQYFSCLAGFIEAGESAEHAVRREIMEETGISVTNIRYFGSQSWPFPSQLMLGFTAEYESGEIQVQESEIQRASWFNRHNCPATPPEGSLAYQLIHHAL